MKRYIVKIGIASEEEMKQRTLDIAAGRRRRECGEPRVWFTSLRSAAEVLSERNRELLRILAAEAPDSVTSLAELTHRQPGNLSRTLKTLEGYGFVELKREGARVRPIARATEFRIYAS